MISLAEQRAKSHEYIHKRLDKVLYHYFLENFTGARINKKVVSETSEIHFENLEFFYATNKIDYNGIKNFFCFYPSKD